jgi:hypothetical protein
VKHKQLGFINFPTGVFEFLFALAAIGIVALFGAIGYVIFLLVAHVRFV